MTLSKTEHIIEELCWIALDCTGGPNKEHARKSSLVWTNSGVRRALGQETVTKPVNALNEEHGTNAAFTDPRGVGAYRTAPRVTLPPWLQRRTRPLFDPRRPQLSPRPRTRKCPGPTGPGAGMALRAAGSRSARLRRHCLEVTRVAIRLI